MIQKGHDRSRRVRTHLRGCFAAAALIAVAASCEDPGNTGRTYPSSSLVREVPWTYGVVPELDEAGLPIVPNLPTFPPIATGKPDPGSRPPDCGLLQGIRTSSAWNLTFEPSNPDDPNEIGVAPGFIGFDDLTPHAFRVPGDVAWYPGLADRFNADYGLPAEKKGGPSCNGVRNEWALHIRGGLFRMWGGGVAAVFTDPFPCTDGTDICPPALPPNATEDSAGLPVKAPDGKPYASVHDFLDASAYEGIAFWARRGPEGESRMNVQITDAFTSERLAQQNQKYCKLARTCTPGCANHMPCAPDDPNFPNPIFRCFDSSRPLPFVADSSLLDALYPRCGPSACSDDADSPDPDFLGSSCQPFYFAAADLAGDYCVKPGEKAPEPDEHCQDAWARSVELTLDWQYYTVPFADLRQGGFGKKAPYLNLKAIDSIAFNFTVGWYDAYIDNLTFYRREK